MYRVTYIYSKRVGNYNGYKKAPESHIEEFEEFVGEYETLEEAKKYPNIEIEKEYPTGCYKIIKVS